MKPLARADGIRLGRSRVRRELRSGTGSVADALTLDCCASMRLGELLECQHGWGPARAVRFLWPLGISCWVTVGNLTARQRTLIEEAL